MYNTDNETVSENDLNLKVKGNVILRYRMDIRDRKIKLHFHRKKIIA